MDISVGNIQAKKISVGNLDIAKVSVGNTLVWPPVTAAATYYAYTAVPVFSSGDTSYSITVPAGATRVGICAIGVGGFGDTAGFGAGAQGGALIWMNVDCTSGEVIRFSQLDFSSTFSIELAGTTIITMNKGADGSNGTGGAGSTSSYFSLPGRNVTVSNSTGGAGGTCSTSGRSGGGGSAGGYTNGVSGVKGGDGQAGGTVGLAGVNGSGASGNGVGTGTTNGQGGGTGLFGQGTNGVAPSGEGSIPAIYSTYYAGGGGRGRNADTSGQQGGFAIRFFCVDYPQYVEPEILTVATPV